MREAILFDMDGTLVPMELETFAKAYMEKLVKAVYPLGYDPNALTGTVWESVKAMIANDGTITNCERCWKVFSDCLGEDILLKQDVFNDFYNGDFYSLKEFTGENPLAKRAVEEAKKHAGKVILATNPVFPLEAVKARLSWVGLTLEDFDYVTSYENSSYCKPNPKYYEEIFAKNGLSSNGLLMVGNDVHEDYVPANGLGMDVFLVTDCIIGEVSNAENVETGTFEELVSYLEKQ